MRDVLDQLLAREDLTLAAAEDVMLRIMSGEHDDAQIAGFLIALRAKGETATEIAGFASAMRAKMVRVPLAVEAIDMCGTGGDGKGTFNISTVASFVVAGAGVKVAKHGNRSITSSSGSADVLAALGVDIDLPPEQVARAVEQVGLGFMFAPSLHPAMRHVMPARKALAVRTVFNILGPLCNPAGITRQLIGLFDGELSGTLADVLKQLGARHALLVHSDDGLDELTTTAATEVTQLLPSGEIQSFRVEPSELGLPAGTLDALRGGTPEENAGIAMEILEGHAGPRRDVVLLNAAAGLLVGDKAADLRAGIALAAESIDSGRALQVLRELVDFA